MPVASRIALALGLAVATSAAPNSIEAPIGADKLTVALLGGKTSRSFANDTSWL